MIVGQSLPGDNPHPLAAVRRPDIVSTHHERPSGVACRFQVGEDFVGSDSSEARYVLSKYPSGSEFSDESCVLGPEVPLVCLPALLPSDRERLAGEAAADDVNPPDSGVSQSSPGKSSNVSEDRHSGPSLVEDCDWVWLDLAESDCAKSAGSLEPEADTPDAAEQVEDI